LGDRIWLCNLGRIIENQNHSKFPLSICMILQYTQKANYSIATTEILIQKQIKIQNVKFGKSKDFCCC